MTKEEAVKKLNQAKGDLAIFKEQVALRPALSLQDTSVKLEELEDAVAVAQAAVDQSAEEE